MFELTSWLACYELQIFYSVSRFFGGWYLILRLGDRKFNRKLVMQGVKIAERE
jgi:hypothetical protein